MRKKIKEILYALSTVLLASCFLVFVGAVARFLVWSLVGGWNFAEKILP